MRAIALLAWLGVGVACASLAFCAEVAEPERVLDARFAQWLGEEGLQGMVWSLRTAEGTQVGAAGARDADDRRPVRVQDRVNVGSIAKTVLALGILRLVRLGHIDLDAPVQTLLPEVAFDNPWSASDPVRVRHLLDHTAGIDDARLGQVFSHCIEADTPLLEALVGWPDVLRVRVRPGTRTSYSNTGYTILGLLIERVTGARYEHWLDAQLLQPLGLADSTFTFVTQVGADADPGLVMGHFEGGVRQPAVPTLLRPAAQFTTTAADMARLADFMLGDGRVDGETFIDAAWLHAMGEPRGTPAADAGLRIGYALGLATRDRHGAVGRCHGGSTVGFRALFCLYPETGRAFFVAWNTDSETARHGRFEQALVEALGVAQAVPVSLPRARVDARAWNGWYVPRPGRFEQLALLDMAFGGIRLQAGGERVQLRPFTDDALILEPLEGALLRAPGRRLASHALLVDEGQRLVSTGTHTHERVAPATLGVLWLRLALLATGMLWLFARGSVRVLRGRLLRQGALFWPWTASVLLLVPLPLFLLQPLLAIGDRTPASIALAIATGVLPLAMLVGLVRGWRGRGLARVDTLAMAAVLQGIVLLAAWSLWPLRLWV